MKKLTKLTALALLAGFVSCSEKPANDTSKVEDAEIVSEKHNDHEQIGEKSELHLNDGEKWEANSETNEGIANMQNAIKKYREEESSDLDSLQMDLFSEFRTLVDKCTMKGEAHDQLHHYIIPLKKKIDGLTAGDIQENVEQLDSYLDTYRQYFE